MEVAETADGLRAVARALEPTGLAALGRLTPHARVRVETPAMTDVFREVLAANEQEGARA